MNKKLYFSDIPNIPRVLYNVGILCLFSFRYRRKLDDVYKIFQKNNYNFKKTEMMLDTDIVLDDIIGRKK